MSHQGRTPLVFRAQRKGRRASAALRFSGRRIAAPLADHDRAGRNGGRAPRGPCASLR